MLAFMAVNGIPIIASDQDIIDIGLGLADGSIKYDDLLEWIKNHK